MKAISITQPWAELLMAGVLPVLNWSSELNYRGRLLIHAPMTHSIQAAEWLAEHHIVVERECSYGKVIGVVDLEDCVHISRLAVTDNFIWGRYVCKVSNRQRIKPVIYMGRRGLFDIDDPFVLEQLPQ